MKKNIIIIPVLIAIISGCTFIKQITTNDDENKEGVTGEKNTEAAKEEKPENNEILEEEPPKFGPDDIVKIGEEAWSMDLDNYIWDPPLLAHGRLYVGDEKGKLIAINKKNGEKIWTYSTEKEMEIYWMFADRRNLYFLGQDEVLYAIDANKGELQWTKDIGGVWDFYTQIKDDTLYVNGLKGVHALNATDGKEIWFFEAKLPEYLNLQNNTLYFTNNEGTLYAIDPKDGRKIWEEKLEGKAENKPMLIGEDGTIYYSTNEASIWNPEKKTSIIALNSKTQEEIWRYDAPAETNPHPLKIIGTNLILIDKYQSRLRPLSALNIEYGILNPIFKPKPVPLEYEPIFIGKGIYFNGTNEVEGGWENNFYVIDYLTGNIIPDIQNLNPREVGKFINDNEQIYLLVQYTSTTTDPENGKWIENEVVKLSAHKLTIK